MAPKEEAQKIQATDCGSKKYGAAGDGYSLDDLKLELGDTDVEMGVNGREGITDGAWSSSSFSHSLMHLWRGYKGENELQSKSDAVRGFYEDQNSLLEDFVTYSLNHQNLSYKERQFARKCASIFRSDKLENNLQESNLVRNAVYLSNICNVLLLFAQLFAFLSSMSLALLATLTDAVLDFVSGMMIFITWKLKHSRDKYAYPVGQSRMEPLGVIGMACLMTSATLITLQESVITLAGGKDNARFSGLTPSVILVVGFALFTKLGLYLFCRQSNDISVKSLAVDHLNDVIANSVSITTVYFAQKFLWWLDPVGGIAISLLIINNWVRHTLEHVQNLLGRVADSKTLSLVTFLACNHHPKIHKVDTVRAYHVGNNVFVECDIVLSSDMRLIEAHDIGESLQNRIELLDCVDRAFVHLDTECEHSPYIEHKII